MEPVYTFLHNGSTVFQYSQEPQLSQCFFSVSSFTELRVLPQTCKLGWWAQVRRDNNNNNNNKKSTNKQFTNLTIFFLNNPCTDQNVSTGERVKGRDGGEGGRFFYIYIYGSLNFAGGKIVGMEQVVFVIIHTTSVEYNNKVTVLCTGDNCA